MAAIICASGQRRFAELFSLKLIKMCSKFGFEMSLIIVEAIRGRCASFFYSSGNGFGDIWWTDNPIYFSSIDRPTRRVERPGCTQTDGLGCVSSLLVICSVRRRYRSQLQYGQRYPKRGTKWVGCFFYNLNYDCSVTNRA